MIFILGHIFLYFLKFLQSAQIVFIAERNKDDLKNICYQRKEGEPWCWHHLFIHQTVIDAYWNCMSGIMLGSVDAGINHASLSLVGERHILRQGCYKVPLGTHSKLWRSGKEVVQALKTISEFSRLSTIAWSMNRTMFLSLFGQEIFLSQNVSQDQSFR